MSISNYEQASDYQKINKFIVTQIPLLKTPVIDTKPNRVTIGSYRVITNRKQFEVWQGSTTIHTFLKRNWAVGFAMCLYKGTRNLAEDLIKYNHSYERLVDDVWVYKHHLRQNRQKNDVTREIVFENRLSRVDSEIIAIENKVSAILKSTQIG
jgi:hypothetical protein